MSTLNLQLQRHYKIIMKILWSSHTQDFGHIVFSVAISRRYLLHKLFIFLHHFMLNIIWKYISISS